MNKTTRFFFFFIVKYFSNRSNKTVVPLLNKSVSCNHTFLCFDVTVTTPDGRFHNNSIN